MTPRRRSPNVVYVGDVLATGVVGLCYRVYQVAPYYWKARVA